MRQYIEIKSLNSNLKPDYAHLHPYKINQILEIDFMSNNQTPDELPLNLKLFFESFVKAVESKDRETLNTLISDKYRSDTLMNKNKKDLISFIITNLPEIPFLKFKLNVDFLKVDFDEERDTYNVTIKPNYTYKFLWLNLVTGIFGRAEIVSVFLEKRTRTQLYWIVSVDEVDTNLPSKGEEDA